MYRMSIFSSKNLVWFHAIIFCSIGFAWVGGSLCGSFRFYVFVIILSIWGPYMFVIKWIVYDSNFIICDTSILNLINKNFRRKSFCASQNYIWFPFLWLPFPSRTITKRTRTKSYQILVSRNGRTKYIESFFSFPTLNFNSLDVW